MRVLEKAGYVREGVMRRSAIIFSPSLEVLGVVRVPYEVAMELGSQTASTFRLYWNRHSWEDRRVEHLFWRGEGGS